MCAACLILPMPSPPGTRPIEENPQSMPGAAPDSSTLPVPTGPPLPPMVLAAPLVSYCRHSCTARSASSHGLSLSSCALGCRQAGALLESPAAVGPKYLSHSVAALLLLSSPPSSHRPPLAFLQPRRHHHEVSTDAPHLYDSSTAAIDLRAMLSPPSLPTRPPMPCAA
jgi:hypothetical protein